MIASYRDRRTQNLATGHIGKGIAPDIARAAQRRLVALDAATSLADLRLPGYRLEKLVGDRDGQWSIRVNDQFRLCFFWQDGQPQQVELVDYH